MEEVALKDVWRGGNVHSKEGSKGTRGKEWPEQGAVGGCVWTE